MSRNPTVQTPTRLRGKEPAPQLRLLPVTSSDGSWAGRTSPPRPSGSVRPVGGVALALAALGAIGARAALRRRRSQREVEASRNRAFAELLSAMRQRDEVLAQASHDLKTPLTALKGQAQLLQRLLRAAEAPDADRIRAGLAAIDAAATTAAVRVDRLVDGTGPPPPPTSRDR